MGLGRWALTMLMYCSSYIFLQLFYLLFLVYGNFNQNTAVYMIFDCIPVLVAGWLQYSYYDVAFNNIHLFNNNNGGILQMGKQLQDKLTLIILNY